jgi:hypothetical protein
MKKSFLKKFEEFDDSVLEQANSLAINKFLSVNHRCGLWNRNHRDTLFLDCLVGYFKDEVYQFFNHRNGRAPLVSTFEEILQFSRCGPGASLDARGGSFYAKLFSSHLSCTSRILETAYLNYYRYSPLWLEAENFRISQGFKYKVVPGNRISTVRKNVGVSRVIATEPSLNMFFQLGLAEIMTARLYKLYNVDIYNQQVVNRELARQGSLSDGLVTIDLESASDSISWKMIQEYFPKDVVTFLRHLRSPTGTLPNGKQVNLDMIATMGNGFTFPLQTIIFSCAVRACYRYLGKGACRAGESWSVFGDDIIAPSTHAGALVHLLEHLGFTVNMDKSFFEGPFRESCGSDFFRGQNVRGVYLKRLRTMHDRYAVINQLNLWSARTGILLSKTVKFLLKTVKDNPIPIWDNDDAGLKIPFSLLGTKKFHPLYQSIQYRQYVVKPLSIRFGDGIVISPRGQKKLIYNPAALFLGMLHGSIESGKMNVRHDNLLYRSRLAIAPNWDQSPADSVFATEDDRQRWETAVRLNTR